MTPHCCAWRSELEGSRVGLRSTLFGDDLLVPSEGRCQKGQVETHHWRTGKQPHSVIAKIPIVLIHLMLAHARWQAIGTSPQQ